MADRAALAGGLHRLRSVLARIQNQIELAEEDGVGPGPSIAAGVKEALALLGSVEEIALGLETVAPSGDHPDWEVPGEGAGRVLVIEDDPIGLRLLVGGLRRRGLPAEATRLPLAGLSRGDVLLLDLSAVEPADLASVATIRRQRPILLTGAVGPAARARADQLGANECLTKPATIDDIAAAIRRRQGGPS
ncbi:MAG: hypothetical protein ACREPA_00745 [Candidatus Dormibacteraceae bacterium]